MSKRPKHPTKRLPSLAFEALEPRALLAVVADWWADVGQWATPAWWSEESWWDDSSWWSDQASAADWSADDPTGLGDDVDFDDAAEVIADASEAETAEADEPDAASSAPIVSGDVEGTLSDVEAITQGDDPQACGLGDPQVCAPDGLPEQGQASISEEPGEKANDSLRIEEDPVVAVVVLDVESSVSETDEPVVVTSVTEEVERVDATVTTAAGVVEDFATPVPFLPPVHSEPIASHAADPVSGGISGMGGERVAPRPDEHPGVVAIPVAAIGTPVVAVAAIPVSTVAAIEPALPQAGGISSAAIAARRLAMWAGLMGTGGALGLGGATLSSGGGGESSIGASGLATALPVAGRSRSRLPIRRIA